MQTIKKFINNALKNNSTELRPIILAVLGASVLSTSVLAIMDVNRPFMIALGVIFLVSIVITYWGYTIIGSWTTLLAALVTLSILIFRNNGIRDIAVMGLIVVLIGAGLLAGKLGTIIIGSLIILEIGVYGALEAQGLVTNQLNATNYFTDYIALTIAIGMVTILQWLVIDQLHHTIQKAEQELAERKRIQSQLEGAEAQYRGLIESIRAIVYSAEPGLMGAWHFISPRIHEMTGFTPEEWIDDPGFWQAHVHPDDLENILEEERIALSEGKMPRFEYRFKKRDGSYIWIYDESFVVLDANTQLVQGFLLDVTDRKQTEEQLKSRIAELQAVHGISEKLVQRTDLQKLIHDTGEQIRNVLKADNLLIAIHDPNTNLIHFPYDFDAGILRRDVPIRFGDGMTTQVMEGKKPVIIETDWANRAASMNVINTTSLPAKSSVAVPIMTTERVIGIISLESIEKEYAFDENDAQLLMTIASNLAVAIEKTRLQDSIKHEFEIQEKLVRELEQKNQELERFTYTASHDLKSPLITIRGFLGYLEQDARKGNFERLNIDIQRISDATEKMHRLLSELLDLSRVGRVANQKKEVPFDLIIAEALRRVEGQVKAKQARVRVGSGFPIVFVDTERLIEVIQNLIDNAIKFTSDEKQPDIEINYYLQDGLPVFYVHDNGIGIRKEFQDRVFGLFDKLNPDSEGTGVGLALVKRIIEVHGGKIWVESEVGAGATFCFTLDNSKD
jgi:PAS domain S-box-containing protein